MDFVPLVAFTALLWKMIDWTKSLKAKDWNSVITQLFAWTVGAGAVMLFAHSMFGDAIAVMGGLKMSSLGAVEQIILGMSVASSAGAAVDVKKALDNTDSAKMPPLTNF